MKKRTKEAAAKILLNKGWTLEEVNAVLVQSKWFSIGGSTTVYNTDTPNRITTTTNNPSVPVTYTGTN
jgi:hypothetical protein